MAKLNLVNISHYKRKKPREERETWARGRARVRLSCLVRWAIRSQEVTYQIRGRVVHPISKHGHVVEKTRRRRVFLLLCGYYARRPGRVSNGLNSWQRGVWGPIRKNRQKPQTPQEISSKTENRNIRPHWKSFGSLFLLFKFCTSKLDLACEVLSANSFVSAGFVVVQNLLFFVNRPIDL